MMLHNPKKIQVLNVPNIISEERMLDKLTIHFQRQSNGGGEVLDVEYPTSVKHCAYIIFEKEEDAKNVLKREHTLQLEEKKYKLDIREIEEGHSNTDNEQVIQSVRTKLNILHFPTGKARQLIFRHGFQVVSYKGSIMEIKGSFTSLKKLQSDLMNLFPRQSPHVVTDLGHSANDKKKLDRDGKSVKSGAFINYRQQMPSRRSSDSSTTSEEDYYSATQHTSDVQSWSSTSRVCSGKSNSSPSPLASSPSSRSVTSSCNIEDTSPHAHRSISGLHGAVGYNCPSKQRKGAFSKMDDSSLHAYSSHSSTGPSASPDLSFTVDRLVFEYLEAYDMNEIHQVLEDYSARIEISYFEDLCEIHLHRKQAAINCYASLSHAQTAVCDHLQKVQQQLRTHQVDLNAMKACEKQKILKRCELLKGFLKGVLLIKDNRTIKLVGPPTESYKSLQYVLGKSALSSVTGSSGPCQRGRRLNRSEGRAKRNSSCPPPKKESPMDDSNANLTSITHAKQTQAQTGDQGQIIPSKPSLGRASQRHRSSSEARKTTKEQRAPTDFDVQDSQTRAGRSVKVQRMKGDGQSNFPEIRQSLNPNPGMNFHRSRMRGKAGTNV
ncbi:uncharacterized protein si:dkey-154b15.1 isoform X2 [Heptranchias perlo]